MQNTKLGFLAKILPFFCRKNEKQESEAVIPSVTMPSESNTVSDEVTVEVQMGFNSRLEQYLLQCFIKSKPCSGASGFPKGLTPCGDGQFADVFTYMPFRKKVIKVTKRDDRPYQIWLEEFVLENQENHNVPRIYSYARLSNGRMLVIMECLAPVRRQSGGTNWHKWSESMGHSNSFSSVEKAARGDETVLMHVPKYIADIANFMKDAKESKGLNPDMHLGNVMFRQSTLVFTDPVW